MWPYLYFKPQRMAKILMFADLHIDDFKTFSKGFSRLNNTLKALIHVFVTANDHGIVNIGFSGDLFNKQKQLPTVVINSTVEVFKSLFEMFPSIDFYAISGNHDLATRSSASDDYITALTYLSSIFDRFHILDMKTATTVDGLTIAGIPYLNSRDEFSDALDTICQTDGVDILMVHQTPDEFMDGEVSVDDQRFKRFKKVFSGHIHEFNEYNQWFIMLGNPLHQNLSDECSDKFICIYDSDTDELAPLPTAGLFPEFKRGTHRDDGNFWIEDVSQIQNESELINNFSTSLKESELLANYCHEIGTDDFILKLGIKCLPKV